MTHVFVSGCYDVLHGGHVQFFTEAKALGDRLTVCFASAEVLWFHKQRRSSLPDEHKRALIAGLKVVDEVVIGTGLEVGIDFRDHFLRLRPNILAVTEDDKWGPLKRELCAEVGAQYIVMPKTPPMFTPTSTTRIVGFIRAPDVIPLRVDFATSRLDGGFAVNCAISPLVSIRNWPYERDGDLGDSAALVLLQGLDLASAPQDRLDAAVLCETGLCVWKTGEEKHVLEVKTSGDFLKGKLALFYTGITERKQEASHEATRAAETARDAVWKADISLLAEAMKQSYELQRAAGMAPLPSDLAPGALAWKHCGRYALFLFPEAALRDSAVERSKLTAVEPYLEAR